MCHDPHLKLGSDCTNALLRNMETNKTEKPVLRTKIKIIFYRLINLFLATKIQYKLSYINISICNLNKNRWHYVWVQITKITINVLIIFRIKYWLLVNLFWFIICLIYAWKMLKFWQKHTQTYMYVKIKINKIYL